MNPLSPFTYYCRHQRHTVLLLSLISLVTAGLYLMIALSWAIFIEPMRLNRMFLTKFSVVLPEGGNELDPAVVAQVTAHPDVAEVVPTTMYYGLSLPHVMGGESVGVFTPLGLRLNLFNLTPWLFTLPIPVAVLAVTTGTIARTLAKLDPVSIIERR
jgi:hypothetical protein